MDYPTKLFGITGFPLGHSMSAALHNWAFKKTEFPGIYMSWPQPPDKLAAFFSAVRTLGISGGNITIPHKVASMALVDRISERAAKIGAINTFYWQDNILCGENTDITGFIAPIKNRKFRHALVLGAGGASRAVVAALKEMDIPRITITNRTFQKAEVLAWQFDIECVPWDERMNVDADFVINTTSQGMKGAQENMTPYAAAGLAGKTGLVYDIVYNPMQTRLLREAENAGWETQNGLAMFVEQARASFGLWTGGIEMPGAEAMKKVAGMLDL